MIFVGEHTSVTQSWVAPAIESGIRGAVQLLLELGLVDEAKEAVDKWMARWIDIVSVPNWDSFHVIPLANLNKVIY